MRRKTPLRAKARKQSQRNKKPSSPYAAINWEKAAVLFQRQTPTVDHQNQYPLVHTMLHALANAGEAGLTFLFEAGKPGIEDVLLGQRSYENWKMRRMVRQLVKQQFVTTQVYPDGNVTVKIARRGRIRALTYQLDTMTITKQKRWDGKWRVVIFDILEKHRRIRDVFRMRLLQLGLCLLQESVYISPYPCFDELEFLRELYGIAFTVRYLLVERLEEDTGLRRHFGLT
ncbi:hypothetical protein HY086_00300 [Candidatus Gottesmanbacteria bacterium]|nr:hypothetical protein [Candidatus Gottesmanbacteria bacterium]